MDAFDADALIYAAQPRHPLGRRVRALLAPTYRELDESDAVGSVVLLPELMAKPMRAGDGTQLAALAAVLARLELLPADEEVAMLAASVGAKHRLRAADALHLATAISAGADRFITNNSADLPRSIPEIDITYPADLADPG